MKIVLDANIFASALIKPDSKPGKVLDLLRQMQIEIVLLAPIIKGIKRILIYPKISRYHRKSAQEINAYFEDLLIFAWMVEGEKVVDVIKADPTDKNTWPHEGEADYIVSRDHHLLDLGTYEGIPIITVSGFLSIFFL